MHLKNNFILILIFSCFLSYGQTQVRFVIESLPNTTPEEDTLFMVGNFNNWDIHDLNYMLHRQLDGKYSIILPVDTGIIVYKFSRGSWLKIETNEKNEHLPDRIYEAGSGDYVGAKIQNWQDLGGIKQFQYLTFFLFATAFYGIAVLFIAYRTPKRNKYKFIAVIVLSSMVIAILLGGVLYNQLNLIWRSYLTMLAHAFLFIWGPVLYISLKAFKLQHFPTRKIIHFLPLIFVLLLSILRLVNFQPISFLSKEINPYLSWGNSIVIWIGFIVAAIYHGFIISHVRVETRGGKNIIEPEHKLFNSICIISTVSLIILAVNYLLLLEEYHIGGLANFEFVLIVLSFIILAEFYYLWKYPDILKEKVSNLVVENAEEIKQKLIEAMKIKKPFKNPELNIADLSEIIDTKPHILSKVLNESFQKNFRDFINEYRVHEFIELANSDEFKNYTYLALAYEVGFNSKSTFNLAFKKIYNASPREYFKKNS